MNDTEDKQTPISSYGKFGLIEHITDRAVLQNPATVLGVGDDASVIEAGGKYILISTDLLLEGIHFNLIYTPLKHLGYKSVVRAISDIYAMNGTPRQLLVALGVSSRFAVEQVDELYDGIYLACKKYGLDLAGGDTTSSLTGMTICVTAAGEVEKDRIVRRDGARPNDLICVTGSFGASYLGLQVLERERKLFDKDKNFRPDLAGYEYLIERQLKPEVPDQLSRNLSDTGIRPTSMIDVSDGLASDLLHICRLSGTGCRVFYNNIPIDGETLRAAEEFRLDPVIPALNGGEDYEILFTVPLSSSDELKSIGEVRMIGHMTSPEKGYKLVSEDGTEIELRAQGWEKG
jgi:thiamine-monophosphate kinase